jgi:hypothetical protein
LILNCLVDVAPELDLTVKVTRQRPAFSAAIFDLETLQSFVDAFAIEASTNSPLPVVNPAAAAAFVNVIDAPRFTIGEPMMLTDINFVEALPSFGVIFIFTMHLPGVMPTIFAPDVLHTDVSEFDTDPVTLEPFGMDIPEALMSGVKSEVVPVLIDAVFLVATKTVVGVVVGVGVVVVTAVVGVVVVTTVVGVVVVTAVVGVVVVTAVVGVVVVTTVVGVVVVTAVVGVVVVTAVVGVVVVGATVEVVGAVGDPVTAFEAGESPIAFTALIVTE